MVFRTTAIRAVASSGVDASTTTWPWRLAESVVGGSTSPGRKRKVSAWTQGSARASSRPATETRIPAGNSKNPTDAYRPGTIRGSSSPASA